MLQMGRNLIVSLHRKLAWHFLSIMKLIFREGSFRSVLSQGFLGLVSEVHHVFSKRDLTFHLSVLTKGNSNRLCVWEISCTAFANKSKGFLCLVLGVSRYSLALGESTINLDDKDELKLYRHHYCYCCFTHLSSSSVFISPPFPKESPYPVYPI